MEQNTQKIFRITIDYQTANANLEEVKKKLKELHEASRELTRKQQELDRQFQTGQLSQAEYTNQTNANRQAMVQNRQSLTALNEEKRRATLETNKLAISEKAGSGSMLQMQSRLIALRSQYRQLTEAQRNNAAVGGKLQREIEQLSNKYRKLEISIGNTSANVGNYIGAFNKMQGTFGMITAGLYAVKKAFQPFVGFEYQMDRVAAVSGATAEQFKQLTEDARRLGEVTEYTASEVAELQLNYARLGFSPEEIIKITQATLDLATATGEDLAKSADVAGATLRGFRLNASEMPRVVDVMAASFNKSALSLDNFTESIKYVAPIAASAGVSLEQTTAMLSVLADAGIRGSMAGTAMRRILTEVATSGKPLNEALQDLTKNGITLQGSFDEVGRHAMTALNVLANGSTQVDSLTVALNDSAGAAKVAADAMRDNLQGDTDKAMSKLEGLAIWFGSVFSPILRGTVQLFTTLLTPIKIATVAVVAWFVALKAGTAIVNLYNATKKGLTITTKASTVSLISETAAMDASTMATKRNMVAIRNTTMATKAYAAMKLVLAGNFKAAALAAKMFFASLGPVGWLALGIGVVAGALAIFSDKSKEASDASSQLALELAQEKATHDDLKRAVLENVEGSKARAEAIRLINERYKEYLPYMLTDKMSNEEIAETLDRVNQKMEENIKIRIKAEEMQRIQQEQLKANKDALDKLIEAYNRNGDKTQDQIATAKAQFAQLIQQYIDSERTINDETRFVAEAASIFGMSFDELRRSYSAWSIMFNTDSPFNTTYDAIAKISEAAEKATGDIGTLMSFLGFADKKKETSVDEAEETLEAVSIRIISLTAKIKTAKKDLLALRSPNSNASEDDIIKKEHDISDLEKRLEVLMGKVDKSSQRATDRTQKQEENAAQKRADFILKQARKLEDIQDQMQDMQISAYEDGLNKKLILSERAGQKELTQQQRANADLLTEMDKHIEEIKKKGAKQTEEDKTQLEQLNQQRAQLVDSGGQIELAIITKNALAREKTLNDANEKELESFISYQMKLKNYTLVNEADRVLYKKKQEAHKSAILQEQAAYEKSVELSEKKHVLENLIITNSAATTKKQKKANQKAQLAEDARYAKEQYDAYKKHLEDQAALGENITAGMLQKLNELKDGSDRADGSEKQQSWLAKSLDITDEEAEQIKQKAFEVASEIANTITQIGMENSQRQLKQDTDRIEASKDKELKALDERKRKGVLSEKQYEKQKEAIDKKAEKQKEQAERAAFEREKKLKIQQVWMNAALGIANVWTQWAWNPVMAGILTAATTIMAGLQTAQIASAKFAQGGMVDVYSNGPAASFGMIRGRSHASGGNQLSIDGRPIAEVEGDETLVILRRGSEQFAPMLSDMNASIGGRRFAQGGIVRSPNLKIPAPAPIPVSMFVGSSVSQVSAHLNDLRSEMRSTFEAVNANIQAVNTRIDNIKVHVVETDVTNTQNSVRAMVQQASF